MKMATVDELVADLAAECPESGGDMMGATDASLAPGGIITSVLLTWVTRQVLKLTCENRWVIEEAANAFINERIRNQVLANVLREAVKFTLDQACPIAS
jgi:hypothetical protein